MQHHRKSKNNSLPKFLFVWGNISVVLGGSGLSLTCYTTALTPEFFILEKAQSTNVLNINAAIKYHLIKPPLAKIIIFMIFLKNKVFIPVTIPMPRTCATNAVTKAKQHLSHR